MKLLYVLLAVSAIACADLAPVAPSPVTTSMAITPIAEPLPAPAPPAPPTVNDDIPLPEGTECLIEFLPACIEPCRYGAGHRCDNKPVCLYPCTGY